MTFPLTNGMLHDAMDPATVTLPLDTHAAGRLLGSYRWIERQLFHVLANWAASLPEVPVKQFLQDQSFEHAWHADLWAERLPDHRGLTPSALTAPPNPGLAELFRDLADENASLTTIDKLVVVYRVTLPRLITAYSSHVSQVPTNDATQRALRLILADEIPAWRVGESHLQALLIDDESVTRASQRQLEVEVALVRSGGIAHLHT